MFFLNMAPSNIDRNDTLDITSMTFPSRLHKMLTEIDRTGYYQNVSAWCPHGRAFVVRDRDLFVRHVLPSFFAMASYQSFQRQANMYGFRQLTGPGLDKGAYYHEFFLRGQPQLAVAIPRQRLKGTGPRKPACPQEEPNFYLMPPMPLASAASAASTASMAGDHQNPPTRVTHNKKSDGACLARVSATLHAGSFPGTDRSQGQLGAELGHTQSNLAVHQPLQEHALGTTHRGHVNINMSDSPQDNPTAESQFFQGLPPTRMPRNGGERRTAPTLPGEMVRFNSEARESAFNSSNSSYPGAIEDLEPFPYKAAR